MAVDVFVRFVKSQMSTGSVVMGKFQYVSLESMCDYRDLFVHRRLAVQMKSAPLNRVNLLSWLLQRLLGSRVEPSSWLIRVAQYLSTLVYTQSECD